MISVDRASSTSTRFTESRDGDGFKAYLTPLCIYMGVTAVLLVVMWFSANHMTPQPDYPVARPVFPGSGVLGGWVRWDGGWYKTIAENGYSYSGPDQQSSVAFFPAYPLAMRLVHLVVRDWSLAGMLVTWSSGLGVVLLLYRWCVIKFDRTTAITAVMLLSVYPYAWYLFGAVYADAFFILAAIAAFVLVEMDRPLLAGLCGVVATAARPVGVAVVIGLVAVTVVKRGGWRGLRRRDAGVLVSGAGLAAWMSYLWIRFGNPMAFSAVEGAPGWDQPAGAHTWLKFEFIRRLNRLSRCGVEWAGGAVGQHRPSGAPLQVYGVTCHWTDTAYSLGVVLQATLMAIMVGLAFLVWKKLGWGYAAYVAGVVLVPLLGSKDFQGVGRYMLAAFPCIAVAAVLLNDHRRWRAVWLAMSALLLIALSSSYARNYYVA